MVFGGSVISVNGVSKTFDGKRQVTALEQIDPQVARGEMLSIVGASGSGKSTLLNLIGGLVAIDADAEACSRIFQRAVPLQPEIQAEQEQHQSCDGKERAFGQPGHQAARDS